MYTPFPAFTGTTSFLLPTPQDLLAAELDFSFSGLPRKGANEERNGQRLNRRGEKRGPGTCTQLLSEQ